MIIAACAPDSSLLVSFEMAAIQFGKANSNSDYCVDNVANYAEALYNLQERLGAVMRIGVTDKVKLNLFEKALPVSLQQSMQRSAPTTLPGSQPL